LSSYPSSVSQQLGREEGRIFNLSGLSLLICHVGIIVPIYPFYSHVVGEDCTSSLSLSLAGENVELSHKEGRREEGKTQPEPTSDSLIKPALSHLPHAPLSEWAREEMGSERDVLPGSCGR